MPDKLTFFSLYFPPFGAPGFDPFPGPVPVSILCEADTQEAADLCSTQPDFPDSTAPQLFFSTAQPCTVNCSDGTVASFTAPANLFYANSQSAANALALAFACEAANSFCGTPRFRNTEQTCEITCEDDSVESYTVIAGSFMGATQADANEAAYAFACSVAAQLCGGGSVPPLFSSVEQSCTTICPDGISLTVTVPAGIAVAFSQADADAGAFLTACALAQLGCDSIPDLFGNGTQTCSQLCNGVTLSYTVPAGVFVAPTLEEANLIAFEFACVAVAQACITGEDVPELTVGNVATSCTIPC